MSELEWVERLAKTMTENKLHKLEFETEDVSLTLRARQAPVVKAEAPAAQDGAGEPEVEEADVTLIRSQDVGLFKPDGSLKPGTEVEVGQKIGIVEAVSVEHELVSKHAGTLVEMLVQDGDPVEYGQPILVLSGSEG